MENPLLFPKKYSGILLLNLPSWGGGKNPWGVDKSFPGVTWHPQVIDDTTIEIIGFTGAFHLAQIQANLQYGDRIAQAKSVKITTKAPLPIQVDGEPWTLNACTIEVSLLSKTKVLLYDTPDDGYNPPITTLDERTRVEIKELASFKFSVEKIEQVKKEHPTNQLNKAQFITVLNQVTGLKFDEKNPALTDRLFTIFDTDKSGSIDFKELNVGLSILGEGTLEKKIKFVFSIFDTTNTGRITKDQLQTTFRTLFSMLYSGDSEKLVQLYVNVLLQLYDENKDQTITYDELLIAAKNDEVLAHLFTFGSYKKE
jgi:Ca2+-binding EF-hand superfamily protein